MSVRAIEIMAWHPEIPGWNLPGSGEEPWQDQALCTQADPEAWFPEKGGSVRRPKAICRACPVRAECLDYALEHGERFGIWGGLTERERRPLLAARINPDLCQKQLHAMTEDNMRPGGGCLACWRIADAAAGARKRAARAAGTAPGRKELGIAC